MKLAISLVAFLALGTVAHGEDFAPMALNSLTRAPANIAAAAVMDQNGRVVGKVQRLVSDQDGKPSAISYVTPGGKLVIVAAPAVSYDGQRNILVTADSPQILARR